MEVPGTHWNGNSNGTSLQQANHQRLEPAAVGQGGCRTCSSPRTQPCWHRLPRPCTWLGVWQRPGRHQGPKAPHHGQATPAAAGPGPALPPQQQERQQPWSECPSALRAPVSPTWLSPAVPASMALVLTVPQPSQHPQDPHPGVERAKGTEGLGQGETQPRGATPGPSAMSKPESRPRGWVLWCR